MIFLHCINFRPTSQGLFKYNVSIAGGHENVYFEDAKLRSVSRPVCRGGNFYDVPGNARCAVRLGIQSVSYSDSRDGFRICLGVPQGDTSAKAISPSK